LAPTKSGSDDVEYLVPPWKHQLEAIERAKDLDGFALFFEMGAGKTATTINILRHKFNARRRVLRTLILAPPITLENWRREWGVHSKMPPDKVTVLTGEGKKRVELFKARAWGKDGLPVGGVFVTNYESLLMPALYAAFLDWVPDVLVLDESHKCKDGKSKRTKLATALADQTQYKYLLSGTPILNSPMDVFAQVRILDGGETFGKNFFAFRATYFYDKNARMPKDRYFPDWQVQPGALERINEKIFTKGMRVTKAECLDLPPLVRKPVYVGMAPEQARLYNEMKRDFITFINDKACVATLAITKALRLMQIASGYVRTDDGAETQLKDTPKMEALRELLEELTPNHKVLIWAVFRENYAQIKSVCESLGIRYVEVHGDISSKQKFENVDAFTRDPLVRVFIGHPGSGGIGINLVAASYSIFYSRTFSLEQDLQAEARNHRGGAEIHDKITRIDLICQGTIEELVLKKLADKVEVSEKILRDLSLEL
jgi:SNF2 family DNA or RNA helicase